MLRVEEMEERVVPATFEVTNLQNAGMGSLRQAVVNVNASADPSSRIEFAAGLNGTISLTSALPVIEKGVTIDGPGANILGVERSQAAGTPQFGIFELTVAQTSIIEGLRIAYGHAPISGGGITFEGTFPHNFLFVEQCVIHNCRSEGHGGGIHSKTGRLNLTGTFIFSNDALNANRGGGIYLESGEASLYTSQIFNNGAGSGGGLYIRSGFCQTVDGTQIYGNVATFAGGGIYVHDSGSLHLGGGTNLELNTASQTGGGLHTRGTVSGQDVTITRNTAGEGGGVRAVAGTLQLIRLTLRDNESPPNTGDGIGWTFGIDFQLIDADPNNNDQIKRFDP